MTEIDRNAGIEETVIADYPDGIPTRLVADYPAPRVCVICGRPASALFMFDPARMGRAGQGRSPFYICADCWAEDREMAKVRREAVKAGNRKAVKV